MVASFIVIKNVIRHCKTIHQVHQVHAHAVTSGSLSLHPSLFLSSILHAFTTLLAAAAANPNTSHPPPSLLLSYALSVFNLIPNPSSFSYNTIIRAHTSLLLSPFSALAFFSRMRRLSVPPDSHTFPFALKASAHLRSLPLAQALHSQALKFGFCADLFLRNSLIYSYSVSGSLMEARRVFHDGYPRDVDLVSYNTLINALVKARETGAARQLFDAMPVRDALSWGTLLSGYAQNNQCREALQIFNQMLTSTYVRPDNVALVSALSACAQLGELQQGKTIHDFIKRNSTHIDSFLCTALVDLYAKCGSIDTAKEIFESTPDRNLFTWNALLVGLALHGHGRLLLDYFSRMIKARVGPDGVTFLGVLIGCSHAGLVCEARRIFDEMEAVYGVPRELKHYGCMADLLGRAGLIEVAVEMIEGMPMKGDLFVWGGLLGGCRIHGNVEIAEKVAEHVMAMNPEDGGVYSVMANVYANAERWDDVLRMRRWLGARRGVKKNTGGSLIRLNGIAHEFVAGDGSHPETGEIYFVLDVFIKHQLEPC